MDMPAALALASVIASFGAVVASFFATISARQAARQTLENKALTAAIMVTTASMDAKLDGRLTALINSIEARAAADTAAARSDAYRRVSEAFTAGEAKQRAVEPPATAAAVADVAIQVAAVQSAMKKDTPT